MIIQDKNGCKLGEFTVSNLDLDNEWQQYLVDVSSMNGSVEIIFDCRRNNPAESEGSKYIFSDITLY